MSGKTGQQPTKLTTIPRDAKPRDDLRAMSDGRFRVRRAMKAREKQHINDLGGQVSAAVHSLIRRAVNLEAWVTATELRIASGALADDDELVKVWLQAINVLSGLYARIGLKRFAREVRLSDVLRQTPPPAKEPTNAP